MSGVSIFYPEKRRNKVKQSSLEDIKPCCLIKVQTVSGAVALSNNKNDVPLFGMLTNIKIEKKETASITPTIGSHLFLYVGGESYYTITATGLAFNDKCDGDASSEINKLIDYYSENNVKQTGKFGRLLIGDKVYKGYLTELGTACSVENDSYFTFSLTFWAIAE